mmetsp:Transcript_24738/g.52710  ORF Transcript_24738/g.52710 Transcript_24738/m.52710 type:complete len:300 (+) Transcript_24738:2193-3092(+)
MGLEEGLEEIVGVLPDHFLSAVVFVSVRETNARRLVEPQHVRGFRPAVLVDGGARSVVVDAAGSVFGQKRQRARASRSARQPNNKGDVFVFDGGLFVVIAAALFEHPEKEVLVPALVVLGSLQVHVPADGFARSIAKLGVFGSDLRDLFSQLHGGAVLQSEIVGRVRVHLLLWWLVFVLRCCCFLASAIKDARGETAGFVGRNAHGWNGGALAPNAGSAGVLVDRAGAVALGLFCVAAGLSRQMVRSGRPNIAGAGAGAGAKVGSCQRKDTQEGRCGEFHGGGGGVTGYRLLCRFEKTE